MKIAILAGTYRPMLNGVAVGLSRRLRHLGAAGHRVLMLSPDYGPIAARYPDHRDHEGEIFENVTVRPVPSGPFMGRPYERNPAFAARAVLKRELARFAPDVIVAHEPERQFVGYGLFPGLAHARRTGTPRLAFYHTNFADWIPVYYAHLPAPLVAAGRAAVRALTGRAYRAYEETLVNTRVAERQLKALGVANTVRDDFNGLDLERFRRAPRGPAVLAETFGIDPPEREEKRLLFVCRLNADKGWPFLLDALEDAAHGTGRRLVRVMVAGDGDMREAIATRLSALFDKVDMLGWVTPERLPLLYANADLHVSAAAHETFGLTALEAMGAGIPALVPGAGGLAEVVDHDGTGLHFAASDRADFSAKLAALLEGPALRDRLGRAGAVKAGRFDWEAASARYEARLLAAVERSRRGLRRARPEASEAA